MRRLEATDFSEKMVAEARKRRSTTNLSFSVQNATMLPYAGEAFDAVIIANAFHIMPAPERALAEISRVLKPNGLLVAPTFVWGMDARQRASEWLLALSGFRVYSRWDQGELSSFVETREYTILEYRMLGGSIRPLCCLIARKR